jgi:SAM-dependent methyltransferase
LTQALKKYGPRQPLPVLVAELNRLYHEHEAPGYERTHPEIFEQLPPIWREMLQLVDVHLGGQKLRILDFGCGTGFEAKQCLAEIGIDRIERMVCYDPSPDMLARSRQSLAPWSERLEFLENLKDLQAEAGPFNVLLTNSVLHHMIDPVSVIRDITPLLSADAVWLSGHEPSRRLFRNPECRSALRRFRAYDRWRRFLSPRRCVRRLLRWARVREFPEDYAARRSTELAMFERRPPARLVSSLVDFHVVVTEIQPVGFGLDFHELQAAFSGQWTLLWNRTYSFLGPHYAGALPEGWRQVERRLAQAHPQDGGNCSLVWRRARAPEAS